MESKSLHAATRITIHFAAIENEFNNTSSKISRFTISKLCDLLTSLLVPSAYVKFIQKSKCGVIFGHSYQKFQCVVQFLLGNGSLNLSFVKRYIDTKYFQLNGYFVFPSYFKESNDHTSDYLGVCVINFCLAISLDRSINIALTKKR